MIDPRWVNDPRAQGGRILVETLDTPSTPGRAPKRVSKRRPFQSQFAQVPIYWIRQLERYNSAAVYQLAHRILLEHHKRQYLGGGEIILSTEVTGLSRQSRAWAIKIMVEAKMIRISQRGNQGCQGFWNCCTCIQTGEIAASHG
jgi:hypothetical protein